MGSRPGMSEQDADRGELLMSRQHLYVQLSAVLETHRLVLSFLLSFIYFSHYFLSLCSLNDRKSVSPPECGTVATAAAAYGLVSGVKF